MKSFNGAAQHEVHRTQPENSEDVRGEYDERLTRQSKDRGHGVHCKNDVACFQTQQRDEQRRRPDQPILTDEEPRPMKLIGHRKEAANRADQEIAIGLNGFTGAYRHPDSRKDQKQSEDPHNPMELHQRGSERDEDRAENQRAEDAVKENAMLILRRYGEVSEDEHEYEDVVDRKRVLHEIPAEKFERDLPSGGVGVECGIRHEPCVLREMPHRVKIESDIED